MLNRARNTLIDVNDVEWTAAEKLDYLNAAITAVCDLKPDAYTVQEFVGLAAGALQSLPEDNQVGSPQLPLGVSLLDVTRNATGEPINQVGRDLLNANSNWFGATPTKVVKEFVADMRNPTRFFVNPPNDGTGSIEIFYGAVPDRLGSESDLILLRPYYESALWAYVVSCCYAKNTKRGDLAKSAAFMQTFTQFIAARSPAQAAVAPKLELPENI